MPCLEITEPAIDAAVKQTLTAAFTETSGQPDWKPVIHICEHHYDNVGVEGKLLSDACEQYAAAMFYYELPHD